MKSPEEGYALGWADAIYAYESKQKKDRLMWQKWLCWKEWENVNDPPCHPGDKDWNPCSLCIGPKYDRG